MDTSVTESLPVVAVATTASAGQGGPSSLTSPTQMTTPTKEQYLQNELDPPLVAATLLPVVSPALEPSYPVELELELVVGSDTSTMTPAAATSTAATISTTAAAPAVMVVDADRHDGDEQSTQPSLDPTMILDPPGSIPGDAIRVYIDDERPNPYNHQETKRKRRGCWKIVIFGGMCCLVGAVLGVTLAYTGGRRDGLNALENEEPLPRPLNTTLVQVPSRSTHPSAAPSCALGLDLTWIQNYTDVSSSPVFASRPIYGHSTRHILAVFANYDAFTDKTTIQTIVVSRSGIQGKVIQPINAQSFQIQSVAVSDDGTTLVLGGGSYVSLTEGVGGAFMILQRLNPHTDLTWNLTHVHFTGGGEYASVSDVAINDNGTVVAAMLSSQIFVVGGNIGVDPGMIVSVYQVTGNGLEPMPSQVPWENITAMAISGDGTRLFTATQNSRIQVFDFSLYQGWTSSGRLFFESEYVSLQASHSGDVLVVGDGSDYPTYPVKVHALVEERWETVDSLVVGKNDKYRSFFPVLSKDGNHVFLTRDADDGTPRLGGDWFQRGPDGFVKISSLIFPLEYASSIRAACFNEDMTQLVVSTDLDLLGYERMCASVLPTASPTISPAPSACISGYGESAYVNISAEVPEGSFVGERFSRTLSQDGSTLVFVNLLNKSSISVVTFSFFGNDTLTQAQLLTTPMSLVTTGLSGDGETLMFGVGSYVQANGTLGGACLVYRREDFVWKLHEVIETAGGDFGTVFDVTSSFDGSVVGFVAGATNGDTHVDVYFVTATGSFAHNKEGISEVLVTDPVSYPSSNGDGVVSHPILTNRPHIILSGSGTRLFVSTYGAIRSLDFSVGCECWFQVGNTITVAASQGDIQVSFNGNKIVIGLAFFPIQLFELKGEYWEPLESSTQLDENDNDSLKWIALSQDGKSIFVAHTYKDVAPAASPIVAPAASPIVAPVSNDDNTTFSTTRSPLSESNQYSTGSVYISRKGYWKFVVGVTLGAGSLLGAKLDDQAGLQVATDEGIVWYPPYCVL